MNGPGKFALSKYLAGTSTVSFVLSITAFLTSLTLVRPFRFTFTSFVATTFVRSAFPSFSPYTFIVAL